MSRGRQELVGWCAALAVAAASLAALDYHVRDPDSVLYAEIGRQLAAQPVSRWIAPTWPDGWYMSGPFLEHPAGLFLLPAVLTRLGYPGAQASFVAAALYQAMGLVLIPVAARAFAEGAEARALGFLLQLLPIAFTFRIRANHEPAVLLFFVLALCGIERVGKRRRAGFIVACAGLLGLMLVKGLLVLPALLCCALWIAVGNLGGDDGESRASREWLALAGAVLVLAAAAAAYDGLYRSVTGQSFVSGYLGRSLSVGSTEGHAWTAGTIPVNAVFYAGRVLWFSFPWSLALAAAAWVWARRTPRDLSPSARGLLFSVGVAMLYIALFSLSTRRAERYIFPAYFVVGAAGAVAAIRRSARLRALVTKVEGIGPLAPPLLWLVLFGLHLAGAGLPLPHIQIWNP
ncbi:MAG: ArnT family glycosyltransferase [Vicinamibacteria bacterium]